MRKNEMVEWMCDDKIGRDLMGSIRERRTDRVVPSPSESLIKSGVADKPAISRNGENRDSGWWRYEIAKEKGR